MKIEVNEKTNKKESAKKDKFWSLPDNLIIALKRFNNNNKKNKEMIDFP